MRLKRWLLVTSMGVLAACNGTGADARAPQSKAVNATTQTPESGHGDLPFDAVPMASFNEPWALAFLPDGRLLVSEKAGHLKLFNPATRQTGEISGVPKVDYGGQGGFGDVVLHPDFAHNHFVYLSHVEAGPSGTRGAAVVRATLALDTTGGGQLTHLQRIWTQVPKVSGSGHYSHRILLAPDGKLFISSGERQKFTPAQDMRANLGKIIRLNDDGSVPADNPFVAQGGIAAQVWTLGHRNALGLAFNPADGLLYEHEMGPAGGDEFNVIERGKNYGYPLVSNGDHYDGRDIPDHDTAPQYRAPLLSWTPVISPSSLVFYRGKTFPEWQGDGLIGGLSSEALIRVRVANGTAREVARYPMKQRIRAIAQAPDGSLWLAEDGKDARLLRLDAAR